MKLRTPTLTALLFFCCAANAADAPGERDGQVRITEGGAFVAWDAVGERWLGPDAFWKSFAGRERGRNWGSGTSFPPYADVNEHDTFLLEVETGTCLMYFFHTRWRRANDVWRWGPEFNAYSGCPDVFRRDRGWKPLLRRPWS